VVAPLNIFGRASYFFRLAREVGYFNFLRRYSLRGLYKAVKAQQKMTLLNGRKMLLPPDSAFGTELFLKRDELDWGAETIMLQYLDKTKCFIDVGANIGYYSLLAAPLSDTVYAFEPDPRVIGTLGANLAQFDNCHVLKEALFSEPGTMEICLESRTELSSLVRKSVSGEKRAVKVNTLDTFMQEYPSQDVSCIKTDAEGADFEILLGGEKLLVRDQPLVLSEAYPDSHLLKFSESLGFACFGFVKVKNKNLSHLPPRFIKIESPPVKYRIKMIFLVPARLLSEFERLTCA
jgi:FkbM family methyltransferase